jgi:adenylate cyclase
MTRQGQESDTRAWLRQARIVSGLVLMAFALTHFLNHALGLVSMELMEAVRGAVVFWHWPWGWPIVALAIAVHMTAALLALYRRRSLKLPAWHWLLLLSGLAVPFFMVEHYIATRVLPLASGKSGGYPLELYVIWTEFPVRHMVGLLVVWLHGCIGIHYWLRLEAWYGRLQPLLLATAVLVPTLALTGFLAAARDITARAAVPGWLDAYVAANDWPFDQAHFDFVFTHEARAIAVMGGLIGLVLLGRIVRRELHERRHSYLVDYGDGYIARAPLGTTLLEASRIAGIPHAAVCGGRGRCSTCRVRVTRGADRLPEPSTAEARVLERLGAPPDVRLACQLRPAGDLAVTRLMPATAPPASANRAMDPAHGIEREIVVLFADLRGFTSLSEGQLPFDVVHLLNRYFQAMGAAIEREGGRVDKFVGDGIMALFGAEREQTEAARDALRAVRAMDAALDALSDEFARDFGQKLRMAIGLHRGPAIVGEMGYGSAIGLTAIGDTVNVASRLESIAKANEVALAVSAGLLAAAGLERLAAPTRSITIRGRRDPLAVALFSRIDDLPREAAPAGA